MGADVLLVRVWRGHHAAITAIGRQDGRLERQGGADESERFRGNGTGDGPARIRWCEAGAVYRRCVG